MSVAFRIVLLSVSVLTAVFVLRKIKKSQFVIGDTIYWLFFCLLLFVLAAFPQIAIKAAGLFKIQSPANLVFVVFIFLLLIRVFQLSVKTSQLETKLASLVQKYALDKSEKDK